MRAAVLICVVALAAAPAMAGWGLRTDKWMEGVTVTSSPFTGGQRLKNPTAGVVVQVHCSKDEPVTVSHGQHDDPDAALLYMIDEGKPVDLGAKGRTLTRQEFLPWLRGRHLRMRVTDALYGQAEHVESLKEFPKHWKKALEKQGCWNEKDWPIRF